MAVELPEELEQAMKMIENSAVMPGVDAPRHFAAQRKLRDALLQAQAPIEPGTLETRFEKLSQWAEDKLGHNPVSAKGFETTIMEALTPAPIEPAAVAEAWQNMRLGYSGFEGRQEDADTATIEAALREGAAAKEAGFWGRCASRLLNRAKAAEAERDALRERVEQLEGLIRWAHERGYIFAGPHDDPIEALRQAKAQTEAGP